MKKITQKMAAFYVLYKSFRKDKKRWVLPSEVDVGDVYIEELGAYVFTSWKTPTRLTDLFQENPMLLEREPRKSKAGAEYYVYRIVSNVERRFIEDPKLLMFYDKVKKAARHAQLKPIIPERV